MILCCGEALIDMLPRETTRGEPAFAPYAGGAVMNSAIALGRLGAPSGWFGGLSNDLFGEQLADTLRASHVDHSLAARSDRPTTLAFVTLTDGQARYAFYDENTAGRMLAEHDLRDLGEKTEALFWELSVVSTRDQMPALPSDLSTWLKYSHKILESWFFELISEELLESFR